MRINELNDAQREAVTTTQGPLLVLAGAGSGKTRVITYRIAHLLRAGVAAQSILALSFTNKAAKEVEERVRALAGSKADGITVSTFHSLGLMILRQEGKRVGMGRDSSIMSEGERRTLLKKIVHEAAPTFDPVEIGSAISAWKNKGFTPEDLMARGLRPEHKIYYKLFKLYEDSLKAQKSLDFDDLILKPAKILELFDDARAVWSERFEYIMVDEYQDTNMVQFNLLKHLAHKRQNICVVGDDDQSIYGWRGAEVELILNFPQHFDNAKTVILDENYRSSANILASAHAVAQRLANRHQKQLRTSKGPGDRIRIMVSDDENEEAETVAGAILSDRFTSKRGWGDYAILYRTNAQSRPFEQALRAQSIPHVVIGGSRFFDRKEVRDVVSYLKVIENPRDDASLLRIANVPKRGLGQQTLLKIKENAEAQGIPLYRALEEATDLPPQSRGGVARLVELIKTFKFRFHSEGLTPDSLEAFIAAARLREDVKESYESKRAVEVRLSLFDDLIRSVEAQSKKGRLSIGDFIDQVTLDPPAEKDEDDGDAVRLLTLHSAKGLEFPIVFMAGMEEGLLPHVPDGEDIGREEEERRLCYVGMTRAKERLILSRARLRARRGVTRRAEPSRFLSEIPEELLALAEEEKSPEEETAIAEDFFSSMRELLNKPG